LLRSGSGFASDNNAVTIIERSGRRQEIPTMLKSQVARIILSSVVEILKEKKSPHLSA
jgi:phosphopantothenoylcysteine synthetase/decarboxylase